MVFDFSNISGPTVPPTKLAHIVLRTHDKKAMAEFYRLFLGAKIVHENDVLSFITYDDEHHRIALAQVPGLKPKDRATCGLEVRYMLSYPSSPSKRLGLYVHRLENYC